MGKGSRARPFSVTQKTFDNNWDNIFKKKEEDMQVRANPEGKIGTCGCGRSPTGNCIGWHGLSEEMYAHQKMLWMEEELKKDVELEEYKKQAQETWSDSCTTPRKNND